MTRILVFADTHLRHRLIDQVLEAEEPYYQLICLGDYWDDHYDTVAQNVDAAVWLKAKLDDPRSIMLHGNHDSQYVFPLHEGIWRRQQHQQRLVREVRAVLSDTDLAKLKLYHVDPVTKILFSHAGVSRKLPRVVSPFLGMPLPDDTIESVSSWLAESCASAMVRHHAGREHPLLAIGKGKRGGDAPVGGIIWEDLDDHFPIPSIVQIVGHSYVQEPLWRFLNNASPSSPPMWRRASMGVIHPEWVAAGATLGLDTKSRHYLIIDTGKRTLTIRAIAKRVAVGEFPERWVPGHVVSVVQISG